MLLGQPGEAVDYKPGIEKAKRKQGRERYPFCKRVSVQSAFSGRLIVAQRFIAGITIDRIVVRKNPEGNSPVT